jgi:hypothetical protein
MTLTSTPRFDMARAMEARPGVLDVSPYPTQPWLDVQVGLYPIATFQYSSTALSQISYHIQ